MELTKAIDNAPEPGRVPALISLPHALVADGREFSYVPFLPGETLGRYIERTGITIARGALAVLHNGCRVPDALWDRLIPKAGDQVIVRARAEGGGSGSKVLRTVALIAVAVVSAGYGATLGGALGFSTTAVGGGISTAAAVGGAIIMAAGTILVGAMVPEVKQ
ncbi:hypothetical protein ACL598_18840 [Bordetella bronchialis]|uniref:hypothetical protein n=1 Tax=Bordetella bronchialis TaxID=463025 RepID=UPI003D03FE11